MRFLTPMMSALSAHEVFNTDDVMFEILLLLPPETIYKLILVSKRWLQIVSSCFFRHSYLTKWKPSFQLIGFFFCNLMHRGKWVEPRRPRTEPLLILLSTSSIGDDMKSSGILEKLEYYIDSSNGLLLCGLHPNDYYLWNPSTRKQQKLPRPRVHFKELCMSLITEDFLDKGFSYKVIRADCVDEAFSIKLKVETFSSKTTTWSYSELTCTEPISLSSRNPGRAIGGIVYWHATEGKIAIYDSENEEKQIDVLKLPKTYHCVDKHVLGESADGRLQYGWSNKSVMEIWKLDKVNDVLQWNILFKLNFEEIWRMNPAVATRYSTQTKETELLAFLNQKSDLVYIRCSTRIFICDTETQRVEVVKYKGQGSLGHWTYHQAVPYFRLVWPSSPLFENSVMMIDTPQCNASSLGSN